MHIDVECFLKKGNGYTYFYRHEMDNEFALRILLDDGIVAFNEWRDSEGPWEFDSEFPLDFERVNLEEADLRKVDFSFMQLRKANLKLANLENAYFNDANLSEANLTGAKLKGTSLKGVNLSGANLLDTKITQKQLSQAFGNRFTKLPPHLGYPVHWIDKQADLFIDPESRNKQTKDPFKQTPAPAHFIQAETHIDVDTRNQSSKNLLPAYKEGTFSSFKFLSNEFADLLDQCNVGPRTRELTHGFAKFINVELDNYQAILGGNKFKSLERCILADWDALSEIAQSSFQEWKKNHTLLEDLYPEARTYRQNEKTLDLPSEAIPDELEGILTETLESVEFKALLTERAQDLMRDIEAQAITNDPQTVKERTVAILTSFNNLTKMLEKIMKEAEQGMTRSLQIVDQAQAIYIKAQPVIEWAKVFLDKL